MEKIYDLIIIGGGAAGYSAALYAARGGLDTVVIESISPGGQMALTDVIDNYPGFDEGIDGFTLGMKMQSGAEKYGAQTVYGEVTEVSVAKEIKEITVDGALYFARSVVIATGASPRKLGIESEARLSGSGVHYCGHCDGRFYRGRDVAVIGGGNSAVADAVYLSRLARRVYLIHRREELKAEALLRNSLAKCDNVEFIKNATLKEINGEERVDSINIALADGEERVVSVDAVFVSIGREPRSELFRDEVAIDKYGYIVADETTRTNVDGVFAAGDVRTKALRQVVTAAADGAVAAHFAEEYISSLK